MEMDTVRLRLRLAVLELVADIKPTAWQRRHHYCDGAYAEARAAVKWSLGPGGPAPSARPGMQLFGMGFAPAVFKPHQRAAPRLTTRWRCRPWLITLRCCFPSIPFHSFLPSIPFHLSIPFHPFHFPQSPTISSMCVPLTDRGDITIEIRPGTPPIVGPGPRPRSCPGSGDLPATRPTGPYHTHGRTRVR